MVARDADRCGIAVWGESVTLAAWSDRRRMRFAFRDIDDHPVRARVGGTWSKVYQAGTKWCAAEVPLAALLS